MGSINRNIYRGSNQNVAGKPGGKMLKNNEYGYIPTKTAHEENPMMSLLQGHQPKKRRRSKSK